MPSQSCLAIFRYAFTYMDSKGEIHFKHSWVVTNISWHDSESINSGTESQSSFSCGLHKQSTSTSLKTFASNMLMKD